MKILQVINSLNVAGAETLITELSIKLSKDNDVEVFVLGGNLSFLNKKLIDSGINVIRISNKINSIKNLIWLKKHMCNYDIVHSHLSWAQYYTSIASKNNRNYKLITTEHSTSNRRQQNKLFKHIDHFIYNKYDDIVAISQATYNSMSIWQPKLADKLITINNGINVEKFKNALPLDEFENEKIKILMVAAFRYEKDQDTLIKSVALLNKRYELYLVGEGERKSILVDLVESLNLKKRVHFLGLRSDVERLMKSCDIFVLSSHWEGFGLVAAEAMASGLPVIVSNVAGLADVVVGYGEIFEVGDVNGLAKKIENTNIYDVKNSVEKFSIDDMVKEYSELYTKV